jgi:hypothetical protein
MHVQRHARNAEIRLGGNTKATRSGRDHAYEFAHIYQERETTTMARLLKYILEGLVR